MSSARFLIAAAVVALFSLGRTADAQIIFNEFQTGGVDAMELINTGAAAQSIAGWRVEYGGRNTSNSWVAASVAFPAGTSLAPGELITVSENPGSTPTAPGTQVFSCPNIWWETTNVGSARGGAAILVNNLNSGVTMVQWNNAAPPSTFGASFAGYYFPLSAAFGRNDLNNTNSPADWFGFPGNTFGALNPAQVPPPASLVVTLTTNGAGSIDWNVVSDNPALPNAEVYNFVSLIDTNPDGSGPFFGLAFDAIFAIAYPAAPGGLFHTFLDANGLWGLSLPSGALPPGLHAEVVAVTLAGGTVTRVSNVASATF
jgi:hypothetical protein